MSPPPCSNRVDLPDDPPTRTLERRATSAPRATWTRTIRILGRVAGLVAIIGVGGVGCGDSGARKMDTALDSAIRKLFQPRRSPQQYMLAAVSDSDPDVRRDAVARVARSKKAREDWAIKGMIAIATLESEPQTRCVAIRALAESNDPRAADAVLRILNYESQPPAEIRPPEDEARWESTVALSHLSERGVVPADLTDLARATLVERLKRDTHRLTRVAAARGLGSYAHADAAAGLIEGLRDADFAVIAECETALVRLTGHTENFSAPAWEAWMKQRGDALFADRGNVPASRKPPYSTRLGKFRHDARQLWDWAFPPKK